MNQHGGCRSGGNRARVLLLATLVLGAGVPPARAGNLDAALLVNAADVLTVLHERHYRAVGVLPFQVRKVGEQASYTSAPLAVNLPGRLENALVLATSPRNREPIAVLRDAAGVANRAKVGSWRRSASAFEALFRARYPVAWGNATARPDAFLTGLISVAAGRKSARVTVQLFDAKSRRGSSVRMEEVTQFDVAMDRPLLRDLGDGFALSARAVSRGVTPRQRDAWALDQQDEDGTRPSKTGRLLPARPENIAGMAFAIRYNGKKQTIRPLSAGGREWQVDPITSGKVTMVLTRVLKDRRKLGVVLKVNGESTWRWQTHDGLRCGKWVYGPEWTGIADELKGFFREKTGKNLQPFTLLNARESAARAEELGEKAGWIDVDVFGEGDAKRPDDSDGRDVTVTTRGLARSTQRFHSLGELREALMWANNLRPSAVRARDVGGLIVASPVAETGPPILSGELRNPVHLGGISIKYWERRHRRVTD
jgi:hypothetical protein